MRTSKPISTVSYNTEPFLRATLERLVHNGIISWWICIKHLREEDEKKEHYNLFLYPSKMLQTDDLRSMFNELDLAHPELPPLGCNPFRSSNFEDWYLYHKHDKTYLASKGQTRKYHYKDSDFVTDCPDMLSELVRRIDMSKYCVYGGMLEAISDGITFGEFLAHSAIPIQQVYAYQTAWNALAGIRHNELTYRNGRSTDK